MDRYYFHFSSKTDQIPDRKGMDLENSHAAHRQALRLIRATAATVAGETWRGWTIDVTDAHGKYLLTVPFVFTLCSVGTGGMMKRRARREHETQNGRWLPLNPAGDW